MIPRGGRRVSPVVVGLGLLVGLAWLWVADRRDPVPAATPPAAMHEPAATSAGDAGATVLQSASEVAGLTADETAIPSSFPAPVIDRDGYRELDWTELMPPGDLVVFRDQLMEHDEESTRRAEQFGSFNVVETLAGAKMKLAGYVVPMAIDGEGKMREFFFVPYFGACIHIPPPPPNQLLFVHLPEPVIAPEIWEPQWLKGILKIERHDDPLASAAYTAEQVRLELWDG